jgi:glutathione S-transferase
VDDVQITQGDAITRYVGKLARLYPEDDFQALLCDEVMSALEEVNTKIGASFGMKGDELKTARETLAKETLPRYLRWLQSQLESHGGVFFADGRLTIADLKAFVILRWLSSGMLDHIPSDLLAREAPKLDEFMHRVAGLPAIAKHYERRGAS